MRPWRHQMEPFSALLAICAGNSPVTGEFPAQRPVTRRLWCKFSWSVLAMIHNKQLSETILIKFVRIKLKKSDIWIKTRSRFCICFLETGFGFNFLFVYNLIVSGYGLLAYRSGLRLIKQGLNIRISRHTSSCRSCVTPNCQFYGRG